MRRQKGSRRRSTRSTRRVRGWQLALAGAVLATLIFGHPFWLWLTVRPPDAAQRQAALAALAADFPISAVDAWGKEYRVRWAEIDSHVPDRCRRDLSLWNPGGLSLSGPLRARMVIYCLELLDHPSHGQLHAVLRHEPEGRDGRPRTTALGGDSLAEQLAAFER